MEKTIRELNFSENIGYSEMCRFVDLRNNADPESLESIMLSRAWEKAIRIAGIVSVFNNGLDTVEITDEIYNWTLRNIIDPELKSVDLMFKEGSSDDIIEVIRNIIH
jgi:hypothetical protein